MKKHLLLLSGLALSILFTGCGKDEGKTTQYTITVTSDENGAAQSDVAKAEGGATVSIAATPNKGCRFLRWTVISGDAILSSATAASATFTMPAKNVEIKAEFSQTYTITVTSGGNGAAAATIDGKEVSAAEEGAAITLTAEPGDDYLFDKWTVEEGDVTLSSATAASAAFTMPAGNVKIRAEFAEDIYLDVLERITDPAFRAYAEWRMDNMQSSEASSYPAWDSDGDGKLSKAEAEAVVFIDVHGGYNNVKVKSLKGIEYFKGLLILTCNGNNLADLNLSKNTALTNLNCYNNQLTTLDVSNNTAMTYLNCYNNQLTALDVSNNTAMTYLNCYNNQLTTLDVSKNTALTNLNCSNNQLTTIDVSNNTALTYLNCYNNQLTALDVSNNTAMTTLNCLSNQLDALDVNNNTAMTTLICDDNQLTAIDVSKNTALDYLSCLNNRLTTLDVSKNTALTILNCKNNRLEALDISKCTKLRTLRSAGNTQLFEIKVWGSFDLTTPTNSINTIEKDSWTIFVR